LDQALQLDLKLFGISLQKDLTLLDLSLFDIFDAKKNNNNPPRMPLFFFFFLYLFLFKPFTVNCTMQSTMKKLMSLVFFGFFLCFVVFDYFFNLVC
jgi:hypothetical protein